MEQCGQDRGRERETEREGGGGGGGERKGDRTIEIQKQKGAGVIKGCKQRGIDRHPPPPPHTQLKTLLDHEQERYCQMPCKKRGKTSLALISLLFIN